MGLIGERQTVYINSHDRTSGTDANFTYSINLRPNNRFDRITLLKCGIPKSFYNVQSPYNTFVLTEVGVNATITVPVGNYTRTSFQTVIQSLLNSNSPHGYTYAVSIPTIASAADTGMYTYNVSVNSSNQPTFDFTASTTYIYELMGFAKNTKNTFSGNVLTSTTVINMQPLSTIQVHCNLVSNEVMTGNNTDILQTVYATAGSSSFSNIVWICPDADAYSQRLSSGTSNILSIKLTDEDGFDINLNGVNMQLDILFWHRIEGLDLLANFIRYFTITAPELKEQKKPIEIEEDEIDYDLAIRDDNSEYTGL